MTIKKLIEKTNKKLLEKRPQNGTLEGYLRGLLNDYRKDLETLDFATVKLESPAGKCKIMKNIDDSIGIINQVLEDYSRAKISESIESMKAYIAGNEMLSSITIDPKKDEDKYWFRMRLQEKGKKTFPAKEMFHIPFRLRGKVNTQRYSLPGYPCLYISRSAWGAWEEMHEPKLDNFCISCLKPVKAFGVLDLRMVDSERMEGLDLAKVLCTMPLVIACSIKVLEPEDNFKPEYIVPQLVMLALVDDIHKIGCAYTSTRKNKFFDNWKDTDKLDNIALPVKNIQENNLCTKLCSYFEITDATNYEYELLKQAFETLHWVTNDDYGMYDEGWRYENSIFGQLEERLKGKEFHLLEPY